MRDASVKVAFLRRLWIAALKFEEWANLAYLRAWAAERQLADQVTADTTNEGSP